MIERCFTEITNVNEKGQVLTYLTFFCEHYEYDDNPAPWVLDIGQEPVELFGEASHYHQLAFACWDDCVAIDFSREIRKFVFP